MKMDAIGKSGAARALLALLLAWPVLAGLVGCASSGSSSADAARGDIVTDSDEPEVRKRARIRLELAAGYFEQGQTTVALDELKQALAIDPNFAAAYNLRGLVYLRLNDPRLAEESLRRALELAPNDGNVLHNYGWLLCQQQRYAESTQTFAQALANPNYGARAKTWMAQGLCQIRAGQKPEAEYSLNRAFELDPANPVIGYNLANLLFQRGDLPRAQFYIRRLNNSELANAESLWLGLRIERALGNRPATEQLGAQLKKRYPQSRELEAYERGAFHE